MPRHILFVDDEKHVLSAIERLMHAYRDRWEITYLDRAAAAWDLLQHKDVDAVVTDVRMPGLDGLELLQCIQATAATRLLPVVVLTGLTDHDLKRQAIRLGAADVLTKPVNRDDLIARLENVLQRKSHLDGLQWANRSLSQQIQKHDRQLIRSRLQLVCCLGKVAEQHDEQTGNHVIRVGRYSHAIAAALGLDRQAQERVLLAAPLHDIGKIGVPQRILLKRGPLNATEWAVMQRHCIFGESILRGESPLFASLLNQSSTAADAEPLEDPVLQTAARVALCHHEKWDGTGYPSQLAGEEIPREARIVAMADVFDALVSERPYKGPFSEAESLKIVEESAGSHFDPEVHRAFVAALPEIHAIRERYADGRGLSDEQEEFLA
jgi:putative two-component system response regulator